MISRSKKVHGEMFESSEGNTQNEKNDLGPGPLCSLVVYVHAASGLCFSLQPDSWLWV